jgi:hypothetical protein
MRVAVKAVTNRVQLKTIITYDFMLYGSWRFQGQDQSVSFLNRFNQNPARNCCSLAAI